MYHFLDICSIGRLWLSPTISISGITAGISHLSFAGVFLFYFSSPIIFFTRSNNIYHRLYYVMFKIHSHQPFNLWFFFLFVCLDTTFITQSIWSFRIINKFITVLKFRIILFVFVIIISIFRVFQFCNRIISTSIWRIIFSDCGLSVVSELSSFSMFINILFPGRNGGTSSVRHWSLLSPIIFYPDLGLDPFLMDTNWGFYIFFFFGMRFSGVTLALVPPIKPVYPVASDKEDRSLRCLWTSIPSGAGASGWEIMFCPFFHILYW